MGHTTSRPTGPTSTNKALSPKSEPAARDQVLKHKSLGGTFVTQATMDGLQNEPLPYLREKGIPCGWHPFSLSLRHSGILRHEA